MPSKLTFAQTIEKEEIIGEVVFNLGEMKGYFNGLIEDIDKPLYDAIKIWVETICNAKDEINSSAIKTFIDIFICTPFFFSLT